MPDIIKRLISLFTKLKIIKENYKIEYEGQGVSMNQYYNSGHWSTRNQIKNKYKKIASYLIRDLTKNKIRIDEFAFITFYNSKHDPDNISGFSKIIVDQLVEEGVVENDTKKFHKFFAIIPDERMNNNTFEFNLIRIK